MQSKADNLKTLNKAFAERLSGLLIKHGMSKYRFERESGLTHSTLRHIFNGNTKDVMLSSVAKVASVFKMTLTEFFDDKAFNLIDIDFEY